MSPISYLAALLLVEALAWLVWAVLSGFFHHNRHRPLYLLGVAVTIAVCVWLFIGIVSVVEFPVWLALVYLVVHIGWVAERIRVLRPEAAAHRGPRP